MNCSAFIRVIAGAASILVTIGIGAVFDCDMSRAAVPELTPRSVRVRFSDLDLSKADGVTALKARIRGAARQVCEESGTREIEAPVRFDRCMAETTSQALAKVGLGE